MKKQTIADKMREYIQDFRGQLAKGDLSSVPALTRNSGSFFRELMGELPEEDSIMPEVQTFASCVERFGFACEQQDMLTAVEMLEEMEEVLAYVQETCGVA